MSHANNTGLVKEIDRCIQGAENLKEYFRFGPGLLDVEHLLATLQRARDALRWIPVSEKPVITEEYPQFQVYMPRVRQEPFRLAQYVQSDKKCPWSVNGMSRIQATKEITHYRAVPNTPEETER